MPSPDTADYVDLTIYDADPQTIYDAGIAAALAKLTDWQPREDNTEVVLLEALAVEISELVYAVNRVPGAVVETLLRLYGLTRDLGRQPSASITVTLADNLGHTIPAGTRFMLAVDDLADPLELSLDADLVIAPGATAGTGTATGLGLPTSAANLTPIGTPLTVLDPVPYVNTATLATAIGGGTDPEDGDAFLDRGIVRLSRLVTTLVHADHFTAAALEQPYVSRATTSDLTANDGTIGNDPGHVTVAVLGPGGAMLSATDKSDLTSLLSAAALANLVVHVVDATITSVAVTATVVVKDTADVTDTLDACELALAEYLNPDTWEWAGTVYRNELISLLDQVEGVERVATLTAPAADVALSGIGPLTTAGVLTVTEAP